MSYAFFESGVQRYECACYMQNVFEKKFSFYEMQLYSFLLQIHFQWQPEFRTS
jgi:hypothetical protein